MLAYGKARDETATDEKVLDKIPILTRWPIIYKQPKM